MSDQPTKKLYDELDFTIFDVKSYTSQCDQEGEDPIQGCMRVHRLVVASMYYSRLDVTNSKGGQSMFIAFMKDVYSSRQCLDDYSHLVNKHNNLESINEALKAQKLFPDCGGATQCNFTSRHHAREDSTKTKPSPPMDASVRFHAKIMDSFHFYVLHLYECGMRTRLRSDRLNLDIAADVKEEEKAADGDEQNTYFERESTGIARANLEDRDRFQNTTKFNLTTAPSTDEAISSFNIGLTFYYWPAYETMEEFDGNTNQFNMHDHGGHKVSDLFVPQRHSTFKDEIMDYEFIDVDGYEAVTTKVKEYMDTSTVKKMAAYNDLGVINYNVILKYGIKSGTAITSHHLLAVCLYTDFSALCTHFSTTFRAVKQSETLASIKARHACYWWFGKCLRETVELYGEARASSRGGKLSGPFYCGLSVIMAFPAFEVRLCGPTSTSYKLAVSIRFAGDQGVVVQLNNNIDGTHNYLAGFPCGWLSNFKEEDEVLFMGGHQRVKIESVRKLNASDGRGCVNYQTVFGALAKLNAMLNGGFASKPGSFDDGDPVKKKDKIIISNLMAWMFGEKELKIDAYVLDTFQTFCQNKTQMVFNLYYLFKFNDKDLIDLIFYKMKRGANFKPEKDDKTNIFRKKLFKIFQNIENIEIYTTSDGGGSQYIFSLYALLSEVANESWTQITINAVHDSHGKTKKRRESWIYILWSKSAKELEAEYKQKGYKIALEKGKTGDDFEMDCLVIKKL